MGKDLPVLTYPRIRTMRLEDKMLINFPDGYWLEIPANGYGIDSGYMVGDNFRTTKRNLSDSEMADFLREHDSDYGLIFEVKG